jgi:hypothetical protein
MCMRVARMITSLNLKNMLKMPFLGFVHDLRI